MHFTGSPGVQAAGSCALPVALVQRLLKSCAFGSLGIITCDGVALACGWRWAGRFQRRPRRLRRLWRGAAGRRRRRRRRRQAPQHEQVVDGAGGALAAEHQRAGVGSSGRRGRVSAGDRVRCGGREQRQAVAVAPLRSRSRGPHLAPGAPVRVHGRTVVGVRWEVMHRRCMRAASGQAQSHAALMARLPSGACICTIVSDDQ